MLVPFFKYQGTGNDFILFDNRLGTLSLSVKQIKTLCNRKFGIGGDGLMLLHKHQDYDFEMKYYNADGRQGSMCGNGGRCLVKFAYDIGVRQTAYQFLAIDGVHEAFIKEEYKIALKMNDVAGIEHHLAHSIVNTGSPHYVHLTTDVMHLDVYRNGRKIRYSREFEQEGININFVELLPEKHRILVRTYERGVEDETLSCGTGVTAAALVCHHNDKGFNSVDVQTKGGNLNVAYDRVGESFQNIWLTGDAKKVFEGTIELQKE